jgi:hypothetical protein
MKVDLKKFLGEDATILERLYNEDGGELPVLTKEDFDNLPRNEAYMKTQQAKEEAKPAIEELPSTQSEK